MRYICGRKHPSGPRTWLPASQPLGVRRIGSRGKRNKGERSLHQVRPESGTLGVPNQRRHLQEELWGGRGDTMGAATPSPGDAGGWAAEANRQRVLFLLQTRTMFPVEMLGSTAAENPLVLGDK